VSRPRLLDLFCGAGGAAMGYYRAGFDVVGVDHRPMPRYPFAVVQADALDYVAAHGHEYDVIHASPPCQRYSRGSTQSATGHRHPDLIAATRAALAAIGRPYIIENVADARAVIRAGVVLCGAMFPGVQTYRHRLFESSELLWALPHPRHTVRSPRSNVYVPGLFMTIYGHVSPAEKAREVMQIDWPMTRDEVVQAIPPAYTEYLGRQLIDASVAARSA
jgi:DNA (cytosine-5)-methyltransferase 1